MAAAGVYIAGIRRWIMDPNRQPNKSVADAFEALLATANAASTAADSHDGDITTLQATVATLQTDIATLQAERDDASLLVPIQYFEPAQVLAVTDNALLTPDGDNFLTPDGDLLLLPGA